MNSQQLQAILLELTQAIQTVIESGEELSDEFQGELANTLQLILERIQEAKQREAGTGQPLRPTTEDIAPGMPSSNVEGFAYDDKNQRLLIRFLGKHPNRNGPIYAYQGVPPVIFDLLRKGAVPARTDGQNKWGKWWKGKVPSLGASLFTLIKEGAYPYQRLS